ncbi:MAG: ribonuclease P protein component [Verrucomicrobiota bacterium]|nr:ribonuclease P protein component [Verrucomicrobiota bacterium]
MKNPKNNLLQFGSAQLPKKQILNLSSEFKKIKDQGKTLPGKYQVMGFLKTDSPLCRIGFIASKRLSNKAVKRNRAKRLLRESFRRISSKIEKDTWIVLIARKYILSAKTQQVQKDLISICKKAGIWEE